MTLKLDAVNPLATKVRTRKGLEVRLLCVDLEGPRPIVAAIRDEHGWMMNTYPLTGRASQVQESPLDLLNVPERRVAWFNFISDGEALRYPSKRIADNHKNDYGGRVACVRVEYTVGQFDEEPAVTEEGAGS